MKILKGFTRQYNWNKLVWREQFNGVNLAISREKQLKNWKIAWKNALIEKDNPDPCHAGLDPVHLIRIASFSPKIPCHKKPNHVMPDSIRYTSVHIQRTTYLLT